MKIYFANGLFSAADRMYNDYCWDKLIEAGIKPEDIYMPQKNLAINDKSASATSLPIYEGDTEKLKEANIIIAVMDGVSIDAGVASEIGWAAGWNELTLEKEDEFNPRKHKNQKLILGLYTDNRDLSNTAAEKKFTDSRDAGVAENQWPYANLYTVGCCKKYGKVFWKLEDLIEYLKLVVKDE